LKSTLNPDACEAFRSLGLFKDFALDADTSHDMVSRSRSRRFDCSQAGFTLVELMTTCMLLAILLTLGVLAIRNYWFTQSLRRAEASVVTEMRSAQQRAMSESHPLVYGVWFEPGESNWGVVKWDGTPEECTIDETNQFEGGVVVQAASFPLPSAAGVMKTKCEAIVPGTGERFVFFYPRGSASDGSVTLRDFDDGKSTLIEVEGVTGRVETV
jgi:prepilin-type N-terminal cleavage/methylation domain-containing protein